MKRWLPFIAIIILILFFVPYLFYSKQKSTYIPRTDRPQEIYLQACKSCHGVLGKGTGMVYPSLQDMDLPTEKIGNIISNGALFMPAFKKIRGDTLQKLIDFVYQKRFLENKKAIKNDGFEQR